MLMEFGHTCVTYIAMILLEVIVLVDAWWADVVCVCREIRLSKQVHDAFQVSSFRAHDPSHYEYQYEQQAIGCEMNQVVEFCALVVLVGDCNQQQNDKYDCFRK